MRSGALGALVGVLVLGACHDGDPAPRVGDMPEPPASVVASGAETSSGVDAPAGVHAVFESRTLYDNFVAEGAASADLNDDGVLDLIAGPLWFAGPDFSRRFELFEAPSFSVDEYSKFFLLFTDDVNGDGHTDVIAIAGPGGDRGDGTANAHWYEHPGLEDLDQLWTRHLLYDGLVSNESPAYADLDGDGASELVFMTQQRLGYAVPSADAYQPWVFTPISENVFNTPYVHGLGVGDVNGDGLMDVLEASGWWEQRGLSEPWVHHPIDFALGGQGGAQMLVFDVDGDNDADVVTSLNAHGYGLSWFEQRAPGEFVSHEILPPFPSEFSFSQLHALARGDLNGDGLDDVVAGKRYYAHPSDRPDPGTDDGAVTYWFEGSREHGFLPHLLHADSGVGCNFIVADVTGDGRSDVFSANKRGVFLHERL